MDLVDAHHHLWIPERREPDLGYGWLRDVGAPKPFGDPTPIQRDYLWAEYAAESDAHRLVGSVHVQTDGALPDPVAETAWVQSVFDRTGLPHAIVGLVDLAAPDLDATLAAHARHRDFRGVRQIVSRLDDRPELSFAPRHLLRDAAWRAGYARLSAHALSFDLQCYPEQMGEVADFLAEHPATPVVLDHAGSPHDGSEAGRRRWREGVDRLAALEHVAVKLSGFGMFDAAWTADSVRALVDHLLDAFGPERVLWGSNFPVERLARTFDEVVAGVRGACDSLDEGACRGVFVDNAARVYRLEPPPADAGSASATR